MLINSNYSKDSICFLEGRDFLLAKKYNWADGYNPEKPMTSMDANHHLNCIKWLIECLKQLKHESDIVNKEIKPLIVNKMNEFKEIFPLVLKNESSKKQETLKVEFNKLGKKFKNQLRVV